MGDMYNIIYYIYIYCISVVSLGVPGWQIQETFRVDPFRLVPPGAGSSLHSWAAGNPKARAGASFASLERADKFLDDQKTINSNGKFIIDKMGKWWKVMKRWKVMKSDEKWWKVIKSDDKRESINWAVFKTPVGWWLVRELYYPIYWGS